MPFFNRQNNDDLILAIQAAGVSRGRNGFRKDKGGEKLAESEEDLLEHRTDGTDAFDTLYIGCEKFPFHDTFSLSMSGVLWLVCTRHNIAIYPWQFLYFYITKFINRYIFSIDSVINNWYSLFIIFRQEMC